MYEMLQVQRKQERLAVSETLEDAIPQRHPLGSTLDPLTKFHHVPGSGSGVKEHLSIPFEQVGEPVSQQLRNRRPDPGPRIECIHPDDFHLQVGRSLKHRVQGSRCDAKTHLLEAEVWTLRYRRNAEPKK